VGLPAIRDEVVTAASVVALRARASRLAPDNTSTGDESRLTVRLTDGSVVEEHVAHARGKPRAAAQPMPSCLPKPKPSSSRLSPDGRRACGPRGELAAAPDLAALLAAGDAIF